MAENLSDLLLLESEEKNTSNYDKLKNLLRDERVIVLDEDIDDGLIIELSNYIIMCNLKDEDLEIENRNPIKIQIETNGGCATTCLNLIEVIKNSKTPIHTIVMGKAYSAGAFLLSCGHKRFAFKNSAILIHQVSFYGYQSVNATNAAKHAEFQNGLCDRLFDSLLGNTKITEEEFSNNRDKEWYLFGDEAKELGIVDYIIGEDVDLQAVIL